MKLLRTFACCVGLVVASNAGAFQLGQIDAQSRLGEPLQARIALFGATSSEALEMTAEIIPGIDSRPGTTAYLEANAIEINVAGPNTSQPYLSLQSQVPLSEPIIEVRVRVGIGGTAQVAHYTLALVPPTYTLPRQITTQPQAAKRASPEEMQTYGPVRAGDSLWGILRGLGLAGGDTSALVEQIVATNPHAFRDADANRLRIGVTLQFPSGTATDFADGSTEPQPRGGQAAQAQQSVLPLSTSPPAVLVTEPVEQVSPAATDASKSRQISSRDPETAARLAALGSKFAAIKARYGAQQARRLGNSTANEPITSEESVPQAAEITSAAPVVAAPEEPEQAVDNAARRSDSPPLSEPEVEASLSRTILEGVAGFILFALLVQAVFATLRHRKAQRANGQASAADEQLVAEIARKAEQRLQLEDDVKRRITEKRSPKANGAGTASDAAGESDLSLEAIENRIAHGQYREAESMLDVVIAQAPTNHRAKLRLAEIYYLNERVEEFVALASEIAAQHRNDIGDDGWQRVMRMGKAIAADRPPFSGPVQVANKG